MSRPGPGEPALSPRPTGATPGDSQSADAAPTGSAPRSGLSGRLTPGGSAPAGAVPPWSVVTEPVPGGAAAGLAVLGSASVRRALDLLEVTDAATLADQLALAAIPAPTGDERARAQAVRDRLAALGLADVAIDPAGNVTARWPGSGGGPTVALAAHLDTVFPAGTDLTVRRDGCRYCAPGIGDNARGLAGLLAVARAVARVPVCSRGDLLFIASVGEEGLGNLRGVRYLFDESPLGRRIAHFIALDGCDARRIVRRAVGSRRYRITVRGPGGHSWGAAGTPSALHALGEVIARLAALPLPTEPRTTLNVGLAGGGSAVNAIAEEAWCEVDIRSIADSSLARLEQALRAAVTEAVEAEQQRRPVSGHTGPRQAATRADSPRPAGRGELAVAIETIGVRPGGETPADDLLVRAARAATLALGLEPTDPASSTDANLPISRGISAITLGAGGRSGGAHTREEWYENEDGPRGVQRVLLTALEVAGVLER